MKQKILLVDDDMSLLTTLGDFLRFEGFDVLTADSGEKALEKLDSYGPDLVILDISMPGMGGLAFLRRISDPQGDPSYPVLVLTARSQLAEFFEDVNVDGFIAKPCSPKALTMEVRRILLLRAGARATEAKSTLNDAQTILLAENEEGIRRRLANAFSGRNKTVQVVSSGAEALESAVIQQPDLLVLKMVLPGMNGSVVADMLKVMPSTRTIPIVIYDDETGTTLPDVSTAPGKGGIRGVVETAEPARIVEMAESVLAM